MNVAACFPLRGGDAPPLVRGDTAAAEACRPVSAPANLPTAIDARVRVEGGEVLRYASVQNRRSRGGIATSRACSRLRSCRLSCDASEGSWPGTRPDHCWSRCHLL